MAAWLSKDVFSDSSFYFPHKEGRGLFGFGWARSVVWVCFFGSVFFESPFLFFFSLFLLFFFLTLRKEEKDVWRNGWERIFFDFRDLLLIYLFPSHRRHLDRFT